MMFPDSWHIAFNCIWIVICAFILLWCFVRGRMVPSTRFPSERKQLLGTPLASLINPKVVFLIFKYGLGVHSIFYIVEMVATSIITKYPAMGATHIPILGIYNLVLLIVGTIVLFSAVTRQAWDVVILKLSHHPVPLLIPMETSLGFSATGLFWVNYMAYCSFHQGQLCPVSFSGLEAGIPSLTSPDRPRWMMAMGWTMGVSIAGFAISVLFVWIAASIWMMDESAELAVWVGQADERDVMMVREGVVDYRMEEKTLLEAWDAETDLLVFPSERRRDGEDERKKKGETERELKPWDWKNVRGLKMLKALTRPQPTEVGSKKD
ncbi:hypothetical protein BC829DRAFT_405904 [Chytridium lagenaria]|nr:hypothetical protein BC829DRAFT_405904 [Chytridium lagenaria]